MGYQSTLLGAVGSIGTGISIASMLHRQSPEYQAKVEKEKLKAKAALESDMKANERDFLKETAGKAYEYKGKVNKNNVVTLDQNARREATLNFHQSNYELAKERYMLDPNPKYIDQALKAKTYANNVQQALNNAKTYANNAQQALNNAKEQKRAKKEMTK